MLLSIIFVITTTLLGSLTLMILRTKPFSLVTHIVLGWLIGFSITSFFLYLLTFIVPINLGTMILVTAIQGALLFILTMRKKLPKPLSYQFSLPKLEQSLNFYICLSIIAVFAIIHLFIMFSQFPETTPYLSAPIIDEEVAVINSILYGTNKRHFIWLDNPLAYGEKYYNSYLPHFYTAGLIALGGDFRSISYIIAYINVISAAVLLFNFLVANTKNQFIAFLIFMFNGGIAAYRPIFSTYQIQDDLLTNVGDKCEIPWYQTFSFILCASKDASFSVCMCLAVFLFIGYRKPKNPRNQYLMAGFFTIFIPNPCASLIMFLFLSSYGDSFLTVMPFSLMLLIKLHGQKVRHFPMWREQQMNGHLVSEVTMIFKAMWLMPLGYIFSLYFNTSIEWAHRDLTAVSVFALGLFIRVGNSNYNNIVALAAVILPSMSAAFADTYYFIKNYNNDENQRSIRGAFLFILYGMFLFGGLISAKRMVSAQVDAFPAESIEASKWICDIVAPNEVVLSRAYMFNPASFCGRQVISGDFKSTWLRGANITRAVSLIRQSELTNWKNVADIISAKALLFHKGSNEKLEGFSLYKNNSKWMFYIKK